VLFLCHAKPKDAEQAAVWKKLVENTLESPDTWEVAWSAGKDKRENFERLLREAKLGGLAVLRRLDSKGKWPARRRNLPRRFFSRRNGLVRREALRRELQRTLWDAAFDLREKGCRSGELRYRSSVLKGASSAKTMEAHRTQSCGPRPHVQVRCTRLERERAREVPGCRRKLLHPRPLHVQYEPLPRF
jgi:hypothetical protein